MNRFVVFLAILAIYITGTLTSPTGSEVEYDTPLVTDCEWDEWGPCEDIKCGIGRQVFKISTVFP